MYTTFKNQSVLVTGGAGFIGTHLVKKLVAEGADVTSIDRGTAIPSPFNFDFIFHLAGQKSAALARQAPAETLKETLNYTLEILEAARASAKTKKIVLVSTVALYAKKNLGELVSECDAVVSDSVYSASKLLVENLGNAYQNEFNTPVVVARLANVYGPGQSTMAAIPSFNEQLKSAASLSVGNTDTVRDFVHVHDVCDALCTLATVETTTGKTLNVSSGTGVSIRQILDILVKKHLFNGEIRVDPKKVRPDENKFIVADNSFIKKSTGWAPKIKIEDGLKGI